MMPSPRDNRWWPARPVPARAPEQAVNHLIFQTEQYKTSALQNDGSGPRARFRALKKARKLAAAVGADHPGGKMKGHFSLLPCLLWLRRARLFSAPRRGHAWLGIGDAPPRPSIETFPRSMTRGTSDGLRSPSPSTVSGTLSLLY